MGVQDKMHNILSCQNIFQGALEEIIPVIMAMIIIVQKEWAVFRFKLDSRWSLNSNLLDPGLCFEQQQWLEFI